MLSFRKRSRLIQDAIHGKNPGNMFKILNISGSQCYCLFAKTRLEPTRHYPSNPTTIFWLVYSREQMTGQRRSAVRPFKQGDVSFPYPRVNLPTTRAPRGIPSLSAKRTIRRAMTSENRWASKKSMDGVIRTRKKERAVPSPLIFINIVMIDKISGEIKWTLSFQYIQLERYISIQK